MTDRAKGVIEDVKGKAKDLAGKIAGDKRLEREGSAQQRKADAELDVAENEAEAQDARTEAAAHEAEQRANQ